SPQGGYIDRSVYGVDDQAAGALADDALHLFGFEPAVIARDAKDHRIAGLPQHVLGAIDQLGISGAHHRRQDHADQAHRALAEAVAAERTPTRGGVEPTLVEQRPPALSGRAASSPPPAGRSGVRREPLASRVRRTRQHPPA